MSIGLFVDFLMHVLLRYYESHEESREAKVKDTMKTMGSSILVGGISTFFGVLPLALSSSNIFGTLFVAFIALVTLGAGHGLILLPLILSVVGPKETVLMKTPEVALVESQQNSETDIDDGQV